MSATPGDVHIDNSSSSPVTLDDVNVDTGGTRYDLWGTGLTVPANGSLILAGTTVSTMGSGGNLDLSNSYACPAPVSLPLTYVTVTVGGVPLAFRDSAQVLNDTARCATGAEGQSWSQLAPSKHGAELWGAANPGWDGVPPLQSANGVNGFTGGFSQTAVDLTLSGRGRNLSWSRTYNSLDAATATAADAVGWGWTDAYAESLNAGANGSVVVHQANGSTIAFYLSGAVYVGSTPQVNASLVKNGDGTYTLTRADQTADTFSANGLVVSQSDRNGYVTSLVYSGGRLSTITDPSSRTPTLGYNGSGQLASVTDSAGRVVSYGYDAASNLATVTNLAGAVTRYGYDGGHRLTTITDVRGGVTSIGYDTASRVITDTDPAVRTTRFGYSASTTTVTNPSGNQHTETYDQNANLTTLTLGQGTPQGASWSYGYDGASNRTSVGDPNNHVTSSRYDGRGNLLRRTDGLGRSTIFSYDSANDLVSVTDPLGAVTTYSYNDRFDLTGRSQTVGSARLAVTLSYGDTTHTGDVTAVTDPNGQTWRYGYEAAGNRSSVTDPLGNQTTYTFNAAGQPSSVVSPRGNTSGGNSAAFTTSYGYDPLGDLTSITDPLGHVTSSGYDAAGNRTSITDADGHPTGYAYDPDGELTRVSRADGSSVTLGYDGAGNLTSQTDGLGHKTAFGVDPLDRLTSTTDPLGRQTTYAYDAAGNRVSMQNPGGQASTATFDAANQLTGISYSDHVTPAVSYTYDADGRRTTMSDGTGTSHYAYDNAGRLLAVTNGAGATLGYGYDFDGRVVSIAYPAAAASGGVGAGPSSGTVTRQHDAAGRLVGVTDWLAHTTSFGYDPDGNPTRESRPDGSVATSAFDAAGHLTQIADSGANGTILNLTYGLDPAGLVAAIGANGGVSGLSQTYAYDQVNRITGAAIPAGAGSTPTNAYGYDAGDNLTTATAGGLTQNLAHDNADQLTAATNTTTGQTASYTYDVSAERNKVTTSAGSTTYAYNQAGRLSGYTGSAVNAANGQAGTNLVQATFGYDGDGLLSGPAWDRTQPTPTAVTVGTTAFVDGPGGRPVEQIDATGTPFYYHQDRLGSTRALTDSGGRIVASFSYDPYGNTTASGTVVTPLLFAGQYTDTTSGFVFLRSRWYDPATAQYLTRHPDPAGPGEPYGYAGWSPTNTTDPSGLSSSLQPIPVTPSPLGPPGSCTAFCPAPVAGPAAGLAQAPWPTPPAAMTAFGVPPDPLRRAGLSNSGGQGL